MEKLLKTRAKITKSKDLSNGQSNRISVGETFDAIFYDLPTVGKSFFFLDANGVPIQTTEVIEIIDERMFRTKNSIYTIVTIEQERDDKINNILK